MDKLLSNPQSLLALLCIVALVIGNLALFGAVGKSKLFQEQARVWGKALSGGAEGRKRQNDQLDELHQRVQQLQKPPANDEEKKGTPDSDRLS